MPFSKLSCLHYHLRKEFRTEKLTITKLLSVLPRFQSDFWSKQQPNFQIFFFYLFQLSGFACFIFSLLVTCICIGLTYVMERSDFYQHYYVQLAENQSAPVDDRPLGERIIAVVKETFNIYLNFGLSVWNYILITFINFTATLCVFPAICTLASSYEYKNCKLSLFNKQILIHTNSTI